MQEQEVVGDIEVNGGDRKDVYDMIHLQEESDKWP
jgi:hypothetical protein